MCVGIEMYATYAPVYVNCECLHNYLNIAEFGMAHGDNNGASNKDQKPILIYF